MKADTTADNQVVAATAATDDLIGVSEPGSRTNPLTIGSTTLYDGFAAINGEDVCVFGLGEVCLLRVGGTVTAGDLLVSDASSRGVTATTGQHYGARAEESGTVDQLIRVLVMQGTR